MGDTPGRVIFIASQRSKVLHSTIDYLSRYGYLSEATLTSLKAGKSATIDLTEALRSLQRRGGLPQTGELDAATLGLMTRPRCALRDIERITTSIEFARWRKTSLTLYVAKYVPGLGQMAQDRNIEMLCKLWRDASGKRLRLTRIESPMADLVISTGRGKASNFDGPGATLAWAYLPNGADTQLLMRYDEDESWDEEMHLGVTDHEGGHLLGLTHSESPADLMAPFFNRSILVPQEGDKRRIVTLYLGSPVLPDDDQPTPTPPPPPVNPPVVPPVSPPVTPPAQPPGVNPMDIPLDDIRQVLAFIRGTDRSVRKLMASGGRVLTWASAFVPDGITAAITEPLSDDQAGALLDTLLAASTSEAQASLSIPWRLLVLWLLDKLRSAV